MKLNLSTKLMQTIIVSLFASTIIFALVIIRGISGTMNDMNRRAAGIDSVAAVSMLGDYLSDSNYRTLALASLTSTEHNVKDGNIADLKAAADAIVNDSSTRIDTIVFLSISGKILATSYNNTKLNINTEGKYALKGDNRNGLMTVGDDTLYIHSEHPIIDDGEIIGAVISGSDIFSDNTFVERIKEKLHVQATIFLKNLRYGTTLTNAKTGVSLQGTKLTDESIIQTVLTEGKEMTREAYLGEHKYSFVTVYSPLRDLENKIIGMMFVGVSTEYREAAINHIINTAILVILLSGTCFGVINYWLVRKILIKPIKLITALCNRLANLDLSQTVHINSSDELGELASSTNIFIDKIRSVVNRLREQVEIVKQSSDNLASVTAEIQENTVSAGSKIQSAMTNVEEMNNRSSTAKKALEDVSMNIITVSTSAEEMTATIGEIAHNSSNARAITTEATNEAAKASGIIKGLGVAAQEISTVTESISNISAQTNILALNATIEAARAGAAGKGFAVVANEIKNLAQETESATGNIHARVNDIQSSTSEVVENVASVTKVINDVNGIVTSIAAAIEEQSSVTKDISSNIGNISGHIQSSNTVIANVYDMTRKVVEELNMVGQLANGVVNGSTQIKISADDLATLSNELKESVDLFTL